MDNQEKLAGLIKDQVEASTKDLKEQIEASKEENAKLRETNKEAFEAMDKLQGQKFVNSTGKVYQYRGYNPDLNKNFKGTLTHEEADQVAKAYLGMINAAQGKAIDFASEMPTEFGSVVLGLAEISSSALAHMSVVPVSAPVFTAPVKATRETADSQSSATANTSTSITAAPITWTIDQRIGSYVEVRRDNLDDSLFDIVNGWVVPMQAEAIGQYVDGEVFNGTNSIYTTSIIDVTSGGVTASGVAAIAAAITFANLNTMFYGIEWERGIGDPKWFGSRAALKSVSGLVDSNGQPIFQQVPINGRPSQTLMGAQYVITPVISDTPANGAMRLCFGDPKHYTIATRGGVENLVNPYILMKEDVIQFIAKFRSDGNVSDNATAASSGAWSVLKRSDA